MATAARDNRQTPRRENAPIRRRRPATGVPDLLFAIAAGAWTMAAVFVIATFVDKEVTAGEAGANIARVFAIMLAITGTFVFALGFLLLRDERSRIDHFRVPLLVGAVVGVAEAFAFLKPVGGLIYVPPFFLVFALRPTRRLVAKLLGQGGKR